MPLHPLFDWNRARAFLATAEEGSFSGAARRLGVTQPTIGRQVSTLEEELGVTLFDRVGPTLNLTETGKNLVVAARAMAEAADALALAALGESEQIDGTVRLSATEAMTAFALPPVIRSIRERYPGIDLELVATYHKADIRRREADIALRNFRPQEHEFVVKRLPDIRGRLYATPEYIAGLDGTVEGLNNASFFGFSRAPKLIEDLGKMGLRLTQSNFPVLSPSHLVQWELTKQGLGICFMSEDVGDREPTVARVLPEHIKPFESPLWLTCHPSLHTSRRVRVVWDFLVETLSTPS